MTTLGVYIPSFGRPQLALSTLRNLRFQIEELKSLGIEVNVKLCLSVNSDNTYDNELFSELADIFIQRDVNLGGDVNIGLGFASAVSERWDYLWIIGDDEPIAPRALSSISQLILNRSPSMIVGTKKSFDEVTFPKSFLELNEIYGGTLTFISSTVYKVNFVKSDVEKSIEFSFSSYSHVAMINLLISANKISEICPLDMQELCDYHFKVLQDPLKPRSEYGQRDSRVFFGKILACLVTNDDDYIESEFKLWWKRNWHRVSMYLSDDDFRGYLVLGISARWKLTKILSFLGRLPYWKVKEVLKPVPNSR